MPVLEFSKHAAVCCVTGGCHGQGAIARDLLSQTFGLMPAGRRRSQARGNRCVTFSRWGVYQGVQGGRERPWCLEPSVEEFTMIMADVFKILFIILGSILCTVSYWLLFQALFRETVEKHRRALLAHPWRVFATGFCVGLPAFLLSVAMLSNGAGPVEIPCDLTEIRVRGIPAR